MKTLENFQSVTVSDAEMRCMKGGVAAYPISGSYTLFGSTFSYSGSVDLTAANSSVGITAASVGGVSSSSTTYTTDFTGQTNVDGNAWGGAAIYINGEWHPLNH